jgi:peptidoglycan hydrolase CwlO-like protein
MKCDSNKVCGWITALSQLSVAAVILYVGAMIGTHAESWTASFKQGQEDLHTISIAMKDIQEDMDTIRIQMDGMNVNTYEMNAHLNTLNKQMNSMNGQVNGVRQRLNPMRMMMPW